MGSRLFWIPHPMNQREITSVVQGRKKFQGRVQSHEPIPEPNSIQIAISRSIGRRIEREICAALGPELKRRGLIFVGIDVIGGEWLTEINVTSPTGIVAIERFDGVDVAGLIWDAIERRVARR